MATSFLGAISPVLFAWSSFRNGLPVNKPYKHNETRHYKDGNLFVTVSFESLCAVLTSRTIVDFTCKVWFGRDVGVNAYSIVTVN